MFLPQLSRIPGGRSIGFNALRGDPWQFKAKPVPWSRIRDWNCIACGECCKHFSVPITHEEWRRIVQRYGLGFTTYNKGRPYLNSTFTGRCVFQRWIEGSWLCTIQAVKPLACRLWPFRICSHPNYGRPDSASFTYRGRQIFVYCDPRCSGVIPGSPSPHLANKVIPEFAAIAFGERLIQRFSTAQTSPLRLILPVNRGYRRTAAAITVVDTLIQGRCSAMTSTP